MRSLLVGLTGLALSAPAFGADLLVPGDYARITDAARAAVEGDRILVEPGSYLESNLEFKVDRIRVEATAPGVVVRAGSNQFDGEGMVFVGIDWIDEDLDIQQGTYVYGDALDEPIEFIDCTFDGIRSGNAVGGAIDVRDRASIIVRNSTFTNNWANEGGAIGTWANSGIFVYDSVFVGNQSGNGGGAIRGRNQYDLVVEGSTFTNNDGSGSEGGAIFHESGGSLTIRTSTFTDNRAGQQGGAVQVFNSNTVLIEDSHFEGNELSGGSAGGAAIRAESAGSFEVRRNTFCRNGVNGQTDVGGALRLRYMTGALVENNVFVDNAAGICGGAICVDQGSYELQNNTFVGNSLLGGSSGAAVDQYPPVGSTSMDFRNNIVSHHTSAVAFSVNGARLAYNLWFFNPRGHAEQSLDATNITAENPLFVSWTDDNLCNDDLHVEWGSPAIDAGDPNIQDPDGSRSDIGAFGGPSAPEGDWADGDGDGSPAMYDCADNDPNNAPILDEICDGQDNDCDGLVDDEDPDAVLIDWYPDSDQDGFGDDSATARASCFANPGEIDNAGDCDDAAGDVNPNATETCDGEDNNCNGTADEGFADTDGDGIKDCLDVEECDGLDNNGNGVVDEGFADNDNDGRANCVDTETCDGIDNDGDNLVDEDWTDTDGDGVIDCPTTEICDGIDNDQNGFVDEGFGDSDGDGVADCVDTESCDGVDNDGDGRLDEGFADNDGDGIGNCVDTETCDGIDNNGNGVTDEGFADNDFDGIANCVDVETCDAIDNDGDNLVDEGFDNDGDGTPNCFDAEECDGVDNDGDGNTDEGFDSDNDGLTDCDPNEKEECDGVDNDGDGLVDDDDPSLDTTTALDWYSDADSDGFGDPNGQVYACLPPADYVGNSADCAPADGQAYPGAVERCNNLDDDCDTRTDEGTVVSTFWLDSDQDGYGDPDVSIQDCTPPQGYVDNAADCDDSSNAISPDRNDFCGDGVDSDCDGIGGDLSDEDGDGIRADLEASFGADDCNPDVDGDSIPDGVEWGLGSTPRDSDNDNIYDIFDEDDDGDGILTFEEGAGDVDGSPIVACDGEAQGCTFAPDGIPNYLDTDSDGDCIPDGTEAFNDADSDGVVDFLDCNDGDGCDGDGDGDGLTNCEEEDLGTNPGSGDSDGDGIPDAVEVGNVSNPNDSDGDGIINALDTDDDGDGVPTAVEDYDGDGNPANDNTDGDSFPDYLDVDDDGDGIDTIDEDANNNGDPTDDFSDADDIPDYLDASVDTDGDGLDDDVEAALGTDPTLADTDGDGVEDAVEVGDPDNPTNTDGDGLIDAVDPDDDNDGIPSADEGGGDVDGDQIPNYLDEDSDGDGILDANETDDDFDGDGIPNYLDTDADGDNVPDAIEGEGDDDGDGRPNYLDAGGGDPPLPPEPPPDGCGCATQSPLSGWLALPVVVGLLRRRR